MVYHRTNSFDSEELGDELVIMELEHHAIVTLNQTGRLIWDMLEEATAFDEIHALLENAFTTMDSATLKSDIQTILDTLVAMKLVTEESGGG